MMNDIAHFRPSKLSLTALFLKFLRFGFLAFGGPVAQIAMIRQALVEEERWIAPERIHAPLMVFLHEGLGSVSMWRDFPAQLCDALGVESPSHR